jgi:protein-tyrosine-phosphatase
MEGKGSVGAPYNVLFLCTGNAARSIIAEAIMNRLGAPRFRAYSAGSHPKGEVSPRALALLTRLEFQTDGLRSKSWEEFAAPGAPQLDFVVTVCDEAANEPCPVWPGQPITAHWSIPDPGAGGGSEADISQAVADAYHLLQDRITRFCALPLAAIDRPSLPGKLEDIGKMGSQTRWAAEPPLGADGRS